MLTLTTPYAAVQFPRLILTELHLNDDLQILTFDVQLWTGLAVNALVCSVPMLIQNGISSLLSKQGSPAAGLVINDPLRYFILSSRSTPTGYTDAYTAARAAANTPAARRTALETLISSLGAGHIDASLAGAIS
jgi:hypothetical protein